MKSLADPVQLWQRARKHARHPRLWQATGLLIGSNIIVALLGLARIPILTRLLSKDEVGMIGVATSILPFLQLLSLSGLDSSAYHYVAKGYRAAFKVNVTVRLRWSMLSALGFLMGAAYWRWTGNAVLGWLFVISAMVFPVTTGLTATAGVLAAREDFGRLFWYRVAEAMARYAGFGLLLIVPTLLNGVLWFYLLNNVALAALQIGTTSWLVRQTRSEESLPMSAEEQHEMVRYGKSLTGVNAISTAQTQTDSLLVGWLLPLNVMADYSIAMLAYAQLKRLWTVYYSIRYPPLVRLPLAQRRRQIMLEAGIAWAGFAVLGVAAGAVLWILVPAVLPQEYVSSLPIIDWLLAAFVVSIPGFFAETYFRTQQDGRSQYLLRGAAAAVGIALPSLFIALWHAQGVAAGRFVAGLAFSALGTALFARDGDSRKKHVS